jgi:hypothetical protein
MDKFVSGKPRMYAKALEDRSKKNALARKERRTSPSVRLELDKSLKKPPPAMRAAARDTATRKMYDLMFGYFDWR